MTSRAEYRLVLRQDNADLRLTEKGYDAGLVREDRLTKFLVKKDQLEREMIRLKETILTPKPEINEYLVNIDSVPLKSAVSLYELLRRPEINYEKLTDLDINRSELDKNIITQIETQIKYEGYIAKQFKQIEQFKKLENKKIPEELDYKDIKGLSLEARQKLSKILPDSLGQASRISGVSPADINVLMIYMEQQKRIKESDG
jgi:tRNA uridine 5-carboxymethylaminomethyl modification enzyme